jgi:hypothetical protein
MSSQTITPIQESLTRKIVDALRGDIAETMEDYYGHEQRFHIFYIAGQSTFMLSPNTNGTYDNSVARGEMALVVPALTAMNNDQIKERLEAYVTYLESLLG